MTAKVPVVHHLWTNCLDLFSGITRLADTVIHNVEELFQTRGVIYDYYLAFLGHQEYSSISDLARY
ncbi:hypothetical protein AAEX28_13865 [Lentisphaerota bacterium WC36G]|nr:hypothetical protein LJT99_00615 [Lentisphaerae bacterium WC36]